MSTAVAEPGTTASPLSAEEIARWTPAQCLAALIQLNNAMHEGPAPTYDVQVMRPEEISDELRKRLDHASKYSMPDTWEVWERIIDEMEEEEDRREG